MGVLLVIDDNVNARVICEVLLESRGESCRFCGQHEPHACAAVLAGGAVAIVEADLTDGTSVERLRHTLHTVKEAARPPSVVVISDDGARVRQAGLAAWADRVLPSAAVGQDLLPVLDALRSQQHGAVSGVS